MITATALAIFMVPVFFVVVRWFFPAKPPLPPWSELDKSTTATPLPTPGQLS
jgi:hypothetical protein